MIGCQARVPRKLPSANTGMLCSKLRSISQSKDDRLCIRVIQPFAIIMNSLRIARSALRARPTAFATSIARRGYADVASDKIRLSLALPHQVRAVVASEPKLLIADLRTDDMYPVHVQVSRCVCPRCTHASCAIVTANH